MYIKKERCTKEWNFISYENNLQKTCQNIIKHMFCLLARDMKNSLNVRSSEVGKLQLIFIRCEIFYIVNIL